tara:strand:+ start:990 stop:1718 length:729 start_codon:yes stop_codon:yes gene_type:complete
MIVSNWKMNGSQSHIEQWIKEVSSSIDEKEHVPCIFCPPACYLNSSREIINEISSKIRLGSQIVDYSEGKALTGGISVEMLTDYFVEYVLIGHSEQREYLKETNASLRAKLDIALGAGISPIFCIGEPEEIKNNKQTEKFLESQLEILTKEHEDSLVIAYEPIWAIGTGLNATKEYIEEVHNFIKDKCNSMLGFTKNISVLYGGSVNLDNCEDILSSNNVDGLLIGGASLDSETFTKIYNFS